MHLNGLLDKWLWFDCMHGYRNNVIVKDIKSALIECYNHAHCSVCAVSTLLLATNIDRDARGINK